MATRKPIGQLLLDKGLVEKEQIQRALEYQQKSGENLRLGEILVKFGYVTEEDVLTCIGEQFDVPVVKLADIRPEVDAVDAVPRSTAKMNNILPLKKSGNSITVIGGQGFNRTILVSASTTYTKAGAPATLADVVVGSKISAQGTIDVNLTTLDAVSVAISK